MTEQQISVFEIAQIWNCDHAFQNRCPKEWASLQPTESNGVRYCHACEQNVTYCATPEEFVRLGNARHCVAVPDGHSPATLNTRLMGRPSPQALRDLEDRQSRVEEWWATTLACDPQFSADAMATIAQNIRDRNKPPRELSPEYRQYLTDPGNAIREGPNALYLHLRTRPSGKRENQQNIFKAMKMHFNLTFREFKTLATHLDKIHPL